MLSSAVRDWAGRRGAQRGGGGVGACAEMALGGAMLAKPSRPSLPTPPFAVLHAARRRLVRGRHIAGFDNAKRELKGVPECHKRITRHFKARL